MKMRNLSKFFCMLVVLFAGQNAWAAQGDQTTCKQSWSNERLNSIVSVASPGYNYFERISDDNLVTVQVMGNSHSVDYTVEKDRLDWDMPRLVFGYINKDESETFNFNWAPASTGYTLAVSRLRALAALGGTGSYFQFADEDAVQLGGLDYTEIETTKAISASATSMPFTIFKNGLINSAIRACMEKFEIEYAITPDAPTWLQAEAEMTTTVNLNAKHFCDLPGLIQVPNPAFAASVKYELTSGNDQYIRWNEDHTMFYAIKPGNYSVRAYIDMVEGKYNSSAYSVDITIVAKSDATEKDQAQVFFFVDNAWVVADETGLAQTSLPWTENNRHAVEYVYGYEDALDFTKKTEYGLNYMTSEGRVDSIRINQVTGQDTVLVKGFMMVINTFKTDNHVLFTLNSELMKKAVITATENASWNNDELRMEFDYDFSMGDRYFEVSFLGIPDSMFFAYGNNAGLSSYWATFKVFYQTTEDSEDSWTELITYDGKPREEYIPYYVALQPNVKKIRFFYTGVQYKGWVKYLTITERKQITLNEMEGDTILISGRHAAEQVATLMDNLKWYNVAAPISWEITGTDAAKFAMNAENINAQLDAFSETNPVELTYQLDEIGVHYAELTISGADLNPKTGAPKAIYHSVLKGVTGYDASEVKIVKLVESPLALMLGDTVAMPFEVRDNNGNVITEDVEFAYDILPNTSAEIDANGTIKTLCVGDIMIVAKLQENLMMPALQDTLYLTVSQQEANVIDWTIPSDILVGDELVDLATTYDDAEMSYTFVPDVMTDLGGNRILVGRQTGKVQVIASAAQTCNHAAMDSVMTLTVKREILDSEIIDKTSELGIVRVDDQIRNFVQVVDAASGDTLTPDAAQVEYSFFPTDGAMVIDDNVIVPLHKTTTRPLIIVAKIWGDTLMMRTKYYRLQVENSFEKVEYVDLPDTMLIDYPYAIQDFVEVHSGLSIDSVFVDAAKESTLVIDPATWTITPKAVDDVMLYARSMGNVDYLGPDTARQMVTFVRALRPINWDKLGDLTQLHVGDVVATSDISVYDNDGHNVTEWLTKSYTIEPDVNAHVDANGDIVMDQSGDVRVIVTIQGTGYQTVCDTLDMFTIGYAVNRVELSQALDNIHVGDTIKLLPVTVYDVENMDITDKVQNIEFAISPDSVVGRDAQGNAVILTTDSFEVVYTMYGVELLPHQNEVVVPIDIKNYHGISVEFPADSIISQLRAGDMILAKDIIVRDETGKDITALSTLDITIRPSKSAYVDADGNIVIEKAGQLNLTVLVTGMGIDSTTVKDELTIPMYTVAELIFPENNDYRVGDLILVDEIVARDERGMDITKYVDLTFMYVEAEKAHTDDKGNIVLDGVMNITILTTASGESVNPANFEKTIYVRHNEDECFELLTQVWNDVLVVNNNLEKHVALGLPQFVSYEWYKDEEVIFGETNQDYHLSANEIKDSAYYYVRATGTDGKQYLICEMVVDEQFAPEASASFKVYPNMVNASQNYTVDVNQAGVIYVTNSNGTLLNSYNVAKGKNVATAPASNGVFVLQFAPANGAYEVQKLIVK